MNQTYNGSGDPLADRRADYAARLAGEGDLAAAADLMRQALERAPRWSAGWMTMGGFLERAGDSSGAADAYRSAADQDDADGQGARLRLALLGAAPAPATAPPAFVRGLFDQYADRFDASLVGRLGYDGPAQILAALRDVAGDDRDFGEVLDLGCGTGLMGAQLRDRAGRLTGVDLSPGMLDKARRKRIYDRLFEGDIAAYDPGETRFDLVTAADVLIYVGDPRRLVAVVAALLAPGGLFAFSIETHTGAEPYLLGPSLRFAHAPAALEGLLATEGMEVLRSVPVTLRQDRGQPVAGRIIVAAAPAA